MKFWPNQFLLFLLKLGFILEVCRILVLVSSIVYIPGQFMCNWKNRTGNHQMADQSENLPVLQGPIYKVSSCYCFMCKPCACTFLCIEQDSNNVYQCVLQLAFHLTAYQFFQLLKTFWHVYVKFTSLYANHIMRQKRSSISFFFYHGSSALHCLNSNWY